MIWLPVGWNRKDTTNWAQPVFISLKDIQKLHEPQDWLPWMDAKWHEPDPPHFAVYGFKGLLWNFDRDLRGRRNESICVYTQDRQLLFSPSQLA